jgi:hypothetical protein
MCSRRWGADMNRRVIVGFILVATIVVVGLIVGVVYLQSQATVKHDTSRWAVIVDTNGDYMAVEPSRDQVWLQLVQMKQNGTTLFVGGIVERYGSSWGFRFKPENVTVAEVTAEGLQGTIRYISQNLDYWLGEWAYVSSRVTEIHTE